MAFWVSLPSWGSLSSLPSAQLPLLSPLALCGAGTAAATANQWFEEALCTCQFFHPLFFSALRPFSSQECCTNSTGQAVVGLHTGPFPRDFPLACQVLVSRPSLTEPGLEQETQGRGLLPARCPAKSLLILSEAWAMN